MKISEMQTKKELFNHDQRIRKLEKSGGQQSADIGDLKETVDKNRDIVEDAVRRIEILEVKSLTVDSAVIKDLQAKNVEISGTLTAITADIKAVKADYVKTSDLEADYTTTTDLKATYATIGALNAAKGDIVILQTQKLDAETARVTYATITNLNAAVGRISKLETDSLTADSATIKNLQTKDAEIETLVAEKATIADLDAAKARISNIEADYITTDELNAVDGKIETLTAKAITTETLSAEVASLGYITADSLTVIRADIDKIKVDKLDSNLAAANYATIENLSSVEAEIDTLTSKAITTENLSAKVATLGYATVGSLNATNAQVSELSADVADFKKTTTEDFSAVNGEIDNIKADYVKTSTLEADYTTTKSLQATYATIAGLNASNAEINTLKTGKLDTETAEATYATITSLNAANAEIGSLKTIKLDVNTAAATYATIVNLNAAVGRISTLETNSLTAESAVITNLQSGLAQLDTLIFGSASGTSIHSSFANAVIAQLGNAQIKSAMIETLSADKITSGSINTDNVTIASADGGMVISDNTIQIKDGTSVRVQIGKDASGNYSVVICDSAGKVMFNTSGITADAIKSAIIRNDMVAGNANISAGKLDIDSLFSEINGSSNTIKATKIYLDDAEQTLDVVFTAAVTDINNISNAVSSQGTQLSVLQGQITSKIWQQDINTAKSELEGDISTLSTRYSTLHQTVSGLSSTVGTHTTQIAGKADKSTVTQVSNQVSTLEQNLRSFKTTVGNTYQTKSDMANYSTTTQMNSAIEQKANSITTTIETTYQKTVSKGEQLVTNGNGLMGNNTNFSAWVFDGAVANNSPGSFTLARGVKKTVVTDEYFPVSTNNEYTFSVDAKSRNGMARMYSMILFYDADKNEIKAGNHIYNSSSTTTLAKNLKSGDTVIYLTDSSGWSTSYAYGFYMTVWNYTNKFGYTYPSESYSRTRITLPKTTANKLDSSCLNKTAHTITLATAYSGATIPAGTSVSQGGDGATYKYFPLVNTLIPVNWTSYKGKISGVDYSGGNKEAMFPPGTAYARIGFLWNYNTAADQLWVTNIVVTDTTAVSAAQLAADKAQSDVTALSTRVTQTESSITSQASSISSLGTRISTVEQTASGITVRLDTAVSDIQTAQNTADTAKTNAANAAKTATNYMKFSSAGLVVGDMTASALGKNVLIYSSGVDIRNGTAVLASFTPTVIKLGNNSSTSKISLLNGIGVIEAVDKDGVNSGDTLRISLNDSESEKDAYLILNKYYSRLYAPSITLNAGSNGLTLTAGHGSASIYLATSFASVAAPYLNIGNPLGNYSSQVEIPYLEWNTWNSKTPYIGYASDQTDGTFVWSITGTNYASGLAIGGGSGNLLYKGAVVLNADNYTSYAAKASHTHSYLSTGGGTLTGKLTVGSASLETNGYVTGTWLKTTANIALSSAATTFAVLNGGWIYSRTAAQVLSDIGAAASGHTHSYAGASSAGGAATKAISDQNGQQIDRIYCSMIPFGTTVPANANLNTVTYMKVGNYFCSANATVATLTNCPSTSAFMMQVYSPLSTTIDNESSKTWIYRLRKLMTYTGDEYIQYCYVGATAGTWTYGAWKKVTKSEDLSSYATKAYVEQLIGDIENGTY